MGSWNKRGIMENFPEITVELNGKKFQTIDYGWEGKDFVAIDKETSIKHVFKEAYLSNMQTNQNDSTIIENIKMSFE